MIPKKYNLNFSNFEYFISEADMASFKQRIDAGAIVKANQSSKYSWTYALKEEGSLVECEVQYSSVGLKSYHCGCGSKDVKKPCLHVLILMFWHIRKIILRNQSPFQSSDAWELENLQQHELIHIIKLLSNTSESSKNWVSYISNLLQVKNPSFDTVLEMISNNTSHIKKLYKNEASVLKYLLISMREVYHVALMAYQNNESEKAITLLAAGLLCNYEFSNSLQTFSKSKFSAQSLKFQSALDEIVPTIIAPVSRHKIMKILFEVLKNQNYSALHYDVNLFQLMHRLNLKKSQKEELLTEILHRIKGKLSDELKLLHLDLLYMVEASYFVSRIPKLVHSQILAPYILSNWLNTRKGRVQSVHALLLYKELFPLLTKEVKQFSLPHVLKYYGNVMSGSPDLFLIDIYYELQSVSALEVFDRLYSIRNYGPENILRYLKLKHHVISSIFAVQADIFLCIMDWDNLLDVLLKSDDIDIIMRYDEKLPEKLRSQLKGMYLNKLIDIKNNFVGQESSKRVQFILSHLKTILDPSGFTELKSQFTLRTHSKSDKNVYK